MLVREAKATLRTSLLAKDAAQVEFEDADCLMVRVSFCNQNRIALVYWCSVEKTGAAADAVARSHVGLWSEVSLAEADFQVAPSWLYEDGFPAKHRANVIFLRTHGAHVFAYLQAQGNFSGDINVREADLNDLSKRALETWIESGLAQAQEAAARVPEEVELQKLMINHVEFRKRRMGAA